SRPKGYSLSIGCGESRDEGRKIWAIEKNFQPRPTSNPIEEWIGLCEGCAGPFDPLEIFILQGQMILRAPDERPVAGPDEPEQIRVMVLLQLPTGGPGGQRFTATAGPAFENPKQIGAPKLSAMGGQANRQLALGDAVRVPGYLDER